MNCKQLFLILMCLVIGLYTMFLVADMSYSSKSDKTFQICQLLNSGEYEGRDVAVFYTEDAVKETQVGDIDAIIVLCFEAKNEDINVVSVEKTYITGCKSIQDCVNKLNTVKGFNIGNHVFIDSSHIRTLVNENYGICVNVVDYEIATLNQNILNLSDKWNVDKCKLIQHAGLYRLGGIQAAAFADLHTEGVRKSNTWHLRCVVWGLTNSISKCSIIDIDKSLRMLSDCSSDIKLDRYDELVALFSVYQYGSAGVYNIEDDVIEFE